MTEKEVDGEWRHQMLDDFGRWLEYFAGRDAHEPTPAPENPDLHDLFAQFVALRQEIRLQNREQSKSVRDLSRTTERFDQAAQRFDAAITAMKRQMRDHVATEKERIFEAENDCLNSFLDLRESLTRGRDAAKAMAERPISIWAKPQRISDIVEGYEITIRRFDNVLLQFNVTRIDAVGQDFDARRMRAVELQRSKKYGDGTVVQELRPGYERGDYVLRTAEVVVNRP